MKEHSQQHRGIKSNTHIECGLIIYNGELHNVGIHWLLRVGEEGREKIGFKFSLLRIKTNYYLSKFTQPPGKNPSPAPQSRIHTKKQESQHMLGPLSLGDFLFSGSARQFPDFIKKRGSFCSSASSSVSLESGTAVLQARYLWHTHCYAAGTSSEAGTDHYCCGISHLQHLAKTA